MKSKNISILLFLLVFAGVTLLGYAQVQAQINLGDGLCSPQESALNLCIRDCDYVIEVLPCDDGTWPCLETIGGVSYKVFRYRAQIAADATLPCDCDTWSYTVTQFQTCEGSNSVDYVLGSFPSGAALFVSNCKVSKCTQATEPHSATNYQELDWGSCNDGYEVWKLNPTLNCKEGGSIDFEIRAAPDAGFSCGNPTWIRDRSGCTEEDNLLRGPGCDDQGIDVLSFAIEDWDIVRDPCTGEPISITSGGQQVTEIKGWFCDPNTDGSPCDPTVADCTCYQVTNIGPDSTGCLFRLNPDRYGYGGGLYSR